MKTSQKTEVKITTSLIGQAYFILLSIAVLPIMLGPTVVLMAVGMAQQSQQRVRIAVLPSCPPESYACRGDLQLSTSTPSTDTGAQNSANNGGISGNDTGIAPGGDSGVPGAGDTQISPGGGGAGAYSGNNAAGNTAGVGGNPEGGIADARGMGAVPGKSLRDIIQEGLSFGEPVDLSEKVSKNQCEYIKKGIKIADDEDGDGLAQILQEGSSMPLLQEDFYTTDPKNPDTDYDSYYDGEEICAGTDPLKPTQVLSVDWNLVKRLKGKIVIQTERHGEAWYMYPHDGLRYYLRNGEIAYTIMRYLSLGITNADVAKIPVGIEPRFKDIDTDHDGLSDKMEEGLKTSTKNSDTDGDGVNDGDEILKNNTDPLGSGVLTYDKKIIDRVRGKILLQVQSRGEAWYVNPADGKRYYMKDGEAAYQIMRFLSLGITNANINKLPIGTLMGKIKN